MLRPWNVSSSAGLDCSTAPAPIQALVATNRSSAEPMGVDAEVGTLEAGTLADLVVVDGHP